MDALFETFKARAEAVSAEVHRFSGRAQALAFILDLLRGMGAQETAASALWADGTFLRGLDRAELSGGAPGLAFQVSRQAAAEAMVGISQVDWAIADTGTLVQDGTRVDLRLVSSLPPVHIALAGTRRILPDLPGALARLRPDQAGCISLITGPSRTSDIERILTIGVHGPERLVIVFVDELEGAAA